MRKSEICNLATAHTDDGLCTSDIRRAARVTAMMARRVADTSVTCNETAVIDMRALFERAMSVCLAADAAAQPTASLLDLEASERPSSSVCKLCATR